MSENLGRAVLKLSTDNSGLKRGLRKGESASRRTFRKMAGFAAGAAIAAGAAFVGLGAKSVAAALSAERAWAQVQVLKPTMDRSAFQGIIGQVQEIQREFGLMTGSFAPAIYQAVSKGIELSAVPLVDFARSVGLLAVGGSLDPTIAADSLLNILNPWKKLGLTPEEGADLILKAVEVGGASATQLSAAIPQVTSYAAALGISPEQMLGHTAFLTAQGVTAPQSVTIQKAIYATLADPKSAVGKAFSEMLQGQQSQTNQFILSQKLTRDELQDIQRIETISAGEFLKQGGNIASALSNLSTFMGKEEFISSWPLEARLGIAALIDNSETANEILRSIEEDSTGTAESSAEIMKNTNDFRIQKLKSGLEKIFEDAGDKLVTVVGGYFFNYDPTTESLARGMI